ncbi:hypothetical protein ACFLRB_01785, partial [Acidobacteriota bacterium]
MGTLLLTFILIINSFVFGVEDKDIEKVNRRLSKSWPPIIIDKELIPIEGTVGSHLQTIFKAHLESCGCKPPDQKSKYSEGKIIPRNYIPPDLMRSSVIRRLYKNKISDHATYGGVLLSRIYSSKDLSKQMDIFSDEEDLFKGYDRFYYDGIVDSFYNCSKYIGYSIDSNLRIPYFALEAALKADFRNKATVSLFYGTYKSLFTKIFDTDNIFLPSNIYYLLELWQKYKEEGLKTLHYLKSFKGFMVGYNYQSGRSKETKLVGNSNLDFFIIKTKGGYELSTNKVSFIDESTFHTFILPESIDWGDCPTLDKIKTAFNQIPYNIELDKEYPRMSENSAHKHILIINNIPASFNKKCWSISNEKEGYKTDEIHKLKITARKYLIGKRALEFTMVGTPQNRFFNTDLYPKGENIPIEYSLKYLENGDSLELDVKTTFESTYHPTITISPDDKIIPPEPKRSSTPNKINLIWEFEIIVDCKNNKINFQKGLDFDSPKIIVNNKDYQLTAKVEGSPSDGNNKGKFKIVLRSKEEYNLSEIDFETVE